MVAILICSSNLVTIATEFAKLVSGETSLLSLAVSSTSSEPIFLLASQSKPMKLHPKLLVQLLIYRAVPNFFHLGWGAMSLAEVENVAALH